MRVSTWDPFAEMETVLNRYRPQESKAITQAMIKADWHPVVDVSEGDDAFHVHAELAGVKKEDIEINVNENVLTLTGQRENKHEQSSKKAHRIERAYGSFARSFSLPDSADAEKIAASFNDGVLEITIPKAKHEKPSPIKVSIN
ncbi:Hsp20/alpha crystallin family protein [Bermanella sp. WJH001]|uniref:Hsp20/alpha crystallin family protein n=1 Tax=Bermanella sp. WJH001 TaxID=3048005 RepID=UPI0024BE3697|nr:Hsp20/alpha crystallin family protein [Bermanella sp. WJH001]MDJ1537359.1 Hsp20/alpha crystallin family protein [Bermanella sp. WJH001]